VTELLPTEQAHDIESGLLDYLTTTFALADQDARLALAEFLEDGVDGIFKGPYLRLRLPFRPAEPGWERVLSWDTGLTPYGHQAEAFARLSSAALGPDRPRPLPTLVTTGTGSGKTESFLFPILDHVLRERRAGRTGMKALILYPMNALANDQAARLTTLLTTNEDLKGITAGLYTGQQVDTRTKVSPAGLITDREVLRDDPPDILLTNYKMLDQLLLRPADQPLWQRSARSLQYLVLDEFHTYDGAQGTDVAMLLRRLGVALKSYWPDGDPAFTEADHRRPLGRITPVATSATLGDRGDPEAMVRFARTVFGDDELDQTCVVTESRLDLPEWVGDAQARVQAAELASASLTLTALGPVNATIEAAATAAAGSTGEPSRAIALTVLAALYETTPEAVAAAEQAGLPLLTLAQAHPLVHRLVETTARAVYVDDLAADLFPGGVAADARTDLAGRMFLLHLVAMLSHVRAVSGRGAASVDLHLWVRELTRVDRVAASTTKYLWSDDGALTTGDSRDAFSWEGRPALPAVYCRHCGRSGWGVGLAPTGTDLDADDLAIRRNHAAHEGRFRALLYAPLEADHAVFGESLTGKGHAGEGAHREVEGLRWFAVKQRAVLTSPPPDDDPDFRDGWVLPVLSLVGPDADEQSRDDTCPSCLQKDGIRFLGSAIATLLSVTLSTLFNDPTLDAREKKALVFTDSVQDAAHRAGFVQSRSHTLTLRSVLLDAVGEDPVALDELVENAIRDAGDDPFRRYRLVPPSLVERPEFETFWRVDQPRSGSASAAARRRVRNRLLFDAVMEFGLQSRVGRTLEATGSVVVEVAASSGLAAIGRSVLAGSEQDTLDDLAGSTADSELAAWVRGVLERMRERGAIEHLWFAKYIEEDGSRFRIWGGRPKGQGMPAFPKGRSVPAFPRVGPSLPDTDPLLDSVTSAQSWYARWAARTLQVSVQHGARLAKALLERLARDGILQSSATKSGGTVFAIPNGSVVVAPAALERLQAGDYLLECTVCRNHYPGTATVVDQLAGAPCLLVRCPGRLRRSKQDDNYYRRLYASGDPRRVVAREHSSLLDDQTRVDYETAFKTGQDDPRSPNVLVATPTLEMGIDIGDLSAVMLASLPRSVASYLQRVGRAGRLTGNALNLAFVTGRGEQLPRLGDPLSVINGQVRPPATYLNAEEILQRQYTAHLIDAMARTGAHEPRRGADVLSRVEQGTFLGDLVELAETDAAANLDAFLAAFDGIGAPTAAALRAWATPQPGYAGPGPASGDAGTSGLAATLYAAAQRWAATLEELKHRRTAIEQSLPGLKQVAELPAATEDDVRAFRAARAALKMTRGQIGGMRDQFWVQALEEHGVLPNYTLLDDTVTLDVAVNWIDPDTQEYESEGVSYRRPSALALRDFAPGAVFYARGLEIDIDSVDLGFEQSAVRPWAFCPDCGYAVDRGAGGAVVAVPSCPRCGGTGISDTKQHIDAIELTRVSAELRRDESAITDRRDDRRRERFSIYVAADVDPDSVVGGWYVEGYDFGLKYLRRMDIRWLNAGRFAGYGAATSIGGLQRPASFFRVCAGCGKLDRAARSNHPNEHRPWCRYRKSSEENTRTVGLMRSLSTQGVVLRLPRSVTLGDVFAVPSLAAALLLGLREQLGGSPDHLAVVQISDPVLESGGGLTHEALLVHDVVPGGTGYLAELADPERLRDLLHRAWVVVRDCPCADEPRLACHRCLLPFAGGMQPVDLVSRQAAERHLRAILSAGHPDDDPADWAGQPWTTTAVPPGRDSTESHLEQHFRQVIRERVKALGATVQEVPGAKGNLLRIGFPHATRLWTLEPQVLLHGSRPDFVLQSNDPNVPLVAIFTDGRQFHATPACNRLADDAAKRRALRDEGVIVLGITARDVEQAADPDAVVSPPVWFNEGVVSSVLQSGQFALATRTLESLTGGPFGFLLNWLQRPEVDSHRTLADIVPLFFSQGAEPVTVPGGDLAGAAGALLDGALPGGAEVGSAGGPPVSAHWWRRGPLGVLARMESVAGALATKIAVVLDDRDEALVGDGHAEAWREWLQISNALNLREQPMSITTVSQVLDGAAGGSVLESTPVADPGAEPADLAELPPEWAVEAELLSAEEARLVRVLAAAGGVPVPLVGHESESGIPINLAWPALKIAVLLEPEPGDREDLQAQGWQVLDPDPGQLVALLATRTSVDQGGR
jgi:ATP-dependent helicase YprA (DUF1998 family)